MDDSPCKKADAFIELDSRDLRSVFEKIHMLEELNRKISGLMDPHIASYCQVANLVGGKLILIAANGSIATQLRFVTADLLKQIKRDPTLQHIHQIECKVRPTQNPLSSRLTTQPAKSMPTLSPATAEIVREIAGSIEDPTLREIMERIAKHTDQNREQTDD